LTVQSFLLSNPIDNTPITRFSELVFDMSNNWTMELYFPFGYAPSITDSIIIKASNIETKLNVTYAYGVSIGIITSDSLSKLLFINRDGDKIEIFTYSNHNNIVRSDDLIFGNYAGFSVGAPLNEYSILRYTTRLTSNQYLNIDCLTSKPSLGVINDTLGLSGIMKGHLYDINKRPITNYVHPFSGQGFFILESVLTFHPDGTYTTPIFNTRYRQGYLVVNIVDFEGFNDILKIEPFELNNIRPDTLVVQDIYLKDSCNYCSIIDAIEDFEPLQREELTLINYPNPFNLSTNFLVKIPDRMKGKVGSIDIYNTNGQLINVIPVHESKTVSWDGRDKGGKVLPSGIYFYQLTLAKQMLKSGSMILLK